MQVFFPSLGWFSCSPLGLSRFVEYWVPFGRFSLPSFLALCCNSQGLSPLQFLLCFNPICDAVVSAFFDQLLSCFLLCVLGLLCCLHHHRMKYCSVGCVHRVCCLLLEYSRLFRGHECLFSKFFFIFVFSFLDDESKHSALSSAENVFVLFCSSPCPSSVRYCRCENSVEQVQSASK